MFRKQFVPMILDGTKTSTFRQDGKMNPGRGTILDMRYWTGLPYRSPQKKFAIAAAVSVQNYVLDTQEQNLTFFKDGEMRVINGIIMEDFARKDGFQTKEEFFDFFKNNYALRLIKVRRIEWEKIERK
jgi:hypothetical protein